MSLLAAPTRPSSSAATHTCSTAAAAATGAPPYLLGSSVASPASATRSATSSLSSSPPSRRQRLSPLEVANTTNRNPGPRQFQHLYVLPVLLMEFLALALTRAVLPSLLLAHYGDKVYIVMGMAECIRGFLAFVSCPLFGKASDVIGRRLCLFVTVAGTCAPVCSLALMFGAWGNDESVSAPDFVEASGAAVAAVEESEMPGVEESEETSSSVISSLLGQGDGGRSSSQSVLEPDLHPHAITIFVALLALSGIFSSTFTIVFAYISDTVRERDERVTAFGLALATFGLSFTIGPMAGGYISQLAGGKQYVFITSFFLTILDLLYIYAILPESREPEGQNDDEDDKTSGIAGGEASTFAGGLSALQEKVSWNPTDAIRLVLVDPFLRRVGQVAFLYYTSLWAVVSTLILYAAKRFEMGPERLGELMSALGLSTMIAEAVLVRIIVPLLGEKRAMRLGLASFALQCLVLGFAYEPWHLFVCAFFSLLGNLVYPSLSSLVSGSVEPEAVGEALGAINGIKALTEGVGPLVFGSLMTVSEHSALPGWPYLIAGLFAYSAFQQSRYLPDIQNDDDEFIHELQRKRSRKDRGTLFVERWMQGSGKGQRQEEEEEYRSLLAGDDGDDDDENFLSEIEESASEDDGGGGAEEDLSNLPKTFSSFVKI
mmetsp:Transcript_36583/g.79967  ORF Transcript_36583/g.79967 Transcript_36583/m.79967 type:complete len:659 (+) Transcript_36583:67-2043(+)